MPPRPVLLPVPVHDQSSVCGPAKAEGAPKVENKAPQAKADKKAAAEKAAKPAPGKAEASTTNAAPAKARAKKTPKA